MVCDDAAESLHGVVALIPVADFNTVELRMYALRALFPHQSEPYTTPLPNPWDHVVFEEVQLNTAGTGEWVQCGSVLYPCTHT